MNTEDSTSSKASDKGKEESATLLAKSSEEDSNTKPDNEGKVLVVTPTESSDKDSRHQHSPEEGKYEADKEQQQSASTKAKEVGQSFKGLVKSASKKVTPSVVSRPKTSLGAELEYNRILVPHDGSEMSDKALNHAIYLSKISGAEIVIIHVVEHMHNVDSSAVLATSKEEDDKDIGKREKESFEITVEGEVKHMIEEKIRLCQQAGVKSQVSYKVQTGKPVDEIVKLSEEMNTDLIVMASSRTPSLTRTLLGSITRKVIDNVEKPLLVIHK
jgi:nucleotide-binding universal stress UspA family protein